MNQISAKNFLVVPLFFPFPLNTSFRIYIHVLVLYFTIFSRTVQWKKKIGKIGIWKAPSQEMYLMNFVFWEFFVCVTQLFLLEILTNIFPDLVPSYDKH